jgi:hypothetical protein
LSLLVVVEVAVLQMIGEVVVAQVDIENQL